MISKSESIGALYPDFATCIFQPGSCRVILISGLLILNGVESVCTHDRHAACKLVCKCIVIQPHEEAAGNMLALK